MSEEQDLGKPNLGDVLRLTSSNDDPDFAGPFVATVLQRVSLEGGQDGVIVKIEPPAYFGPDPLSMRESDRFILVSRAAGEPELLVSKDRRCPVHIVEPDNWSDVGEEPLAPSSLKIIAWGELQSA